MGLAPVRRNWIPERCHQAVRLLAPFRAVQAKMGSDYPQHSLTDQNVRIDSPTRFVAGDG